MFVVALVVFSMSALILSCGVNFSSMCKLITKFCFVRSDDLNSEMGLKNEFICQKLKAHHFVDGTCVIAILDCSK